MPPVEECWHSDFRRAVRNFRYLFWDHEQSKGYYSKTNNSGRDVFQKYWKSFSCWRLFLSISVETSTQIVFMCVRESLPWSWSRATRIYIGLLASDYSSGLVWDFLSSQTWSYFCFVLVLYGCTAKVLHNHSLKCIIQEASSVTKQELSGAGLVLQHVWIVD